MSEIWVRKEISLQSAGTFKFCEEAHVILAEHPEVFHTIFEISDSLDTHTECIAAIHFRIYTA